MTVVATDDDGNEFVYDASGGLVKFDADDDFEGRERVIDIARRQAMRGCRPLVNMADVHEQLEQEWPTDEITVTNYVTGDPVTIELDVEDAPDDLDPDDATFGVLEDVE